MADTSDEENDDTLYEDTESESEYDNDSLQGFAQQQLQHEQQKQQLARQQQQSEVQLKSRHLKQASAGMYDFFQIHNRERCDTDWDIIRRRKSSDLDEVRQRADDAEQCTLLELQTAPYPKGVDITHREAYLSDDVFVRVFGMDKDEFYRQTKWKRLVMKKVAKLF